VNGCLFEEALAYVGNLNEAAYGGYHDWRLPTLEEAMSLMESKHKDFLLLDPLFEPRWCYWTCDRGGPIRGAPTAWVINYERADCVRVFLIHRHSVRAVR
jgi:hypothetical protein